MISTTRALSLSFIILIMSGCDKAEMNSGIKLNFSNELGKVLTPNRLSESPSLLGSSAKKVKMSPDGKRVTYLVGKKENYEQLDLWEYHIKDAEARLLVDSDEFLEGKPEQLSEEEKARRQRQRISSTGIIEYSWNRDGSALLFPIGGDIYVKFLGGKVKKLTQTEAFETDIKFSPNSRYVSFIRNRDLYVINVESGKETRLTHDASDTVSNGMAEFVAQEELNRYTGYWWSPDESKIAFTQVDESTVKVFNRYEIQDDGGVTTFEQRYPAAGTANASIKLGVVNVSTQAKEWIDIAADDFYLARVNWKHNSQDLTYQVLPRNQESLTLNSHNLVDKTTSVLIEESSQSWINLHKDLQFLKQSKQFIWTSEKTGFRHIYRLNNDGSGEEQLTAGDWVVSNIVSVDEKEQRIYFMGFKDSTIERHLYSVSITDKSIQKISNRDGWHSATMGDNSAVYLDSHSNVDTPSNLSIRNRKDDSLITYINENPLNKQHPYFEYLTDNAQSSFGQIKAADGKTNLDYRLLLPPHFDETKQYPAVLAPYGGPHGHRVKNNFSVDFNQVLARNGFVVMVVDNRGSYNRGTAFEAPIKNAMGTVEVEDQVAAAKYLQQLSYVDANRIGFHGWSYGGYMAILMLAKAPEIIKVSVSVAPVTDWTLYDTAYTERYLGLPDAPGNVYENSSVFKYLENLKGKLLLVHGMADDNVFFDNSVKLMSTLQKNGTPFDLMTYPGEKHGIYGKEKKKHLDNLRLQYFVENL